MDPPHEAPTGLAGLAGADCGSPDRNVARVARRDANDSAPLGLSDVAAAAPVRSVHQAISCRPEDVRKPSRGNSVHRGFAGNADGTTHHGGSHQGYMAFKIQKLAEQNEIVAGRVVDNEHKGERDDDEHGQRGHGVFHGVAIYVNGITNPPWIDLKDIVLANGGRFSNYYSRVNVTHIVCAGLTAQKLLALKKADKKHPPVVTPEWVTESLRVGKLLPCAEFALRGTLEPGQTRISGFTLNETKPRLELEPNAENDRGPDVDDGGDTESDPSDEDEVALDEETDDIAPTQEDLTRAPIEPEGGGTETVLRVVFGFVRRHLESLPRRDDDARASSLFSAMRAASAAAYGALAATIDSCSMDRRRIVPVSAWEALVVSERAERASGPESQASSARLCRRREDVVAEAERLTSSLVAAGVDADAVPLDMRDSSNDGIVPVEVGDPLEALSPRLEALVGEAADRKTRTSAKRPGSPSRGDAFRDTKGKRVRWSETVHGDDRDLGSGSIVAREDASARAFRAVQRARRSSFAAAAAAAPETREIDDETWASLPPEVREEITSSRLGGNGGRPARPRDPTTSDSFGHDAFGAHSGVKRAEGKAVFPSRWDFPSRADRVERRPAGQERTPKTDDGLPASFSQIDPEVLEAIGEDEARTLRAHYARAAREKEVSRVRQMNTAQKKKKTKKVDRKNDAPSLFFAKKNDLSSKSTPNAVKETREEEEEEEEEEETADRAAAVAVGDVYETIREEEKVDELVASLETAVRSVFARLEAPEAARGETADTAPRSAALGAFPGSDAAHSDREKSVVESLDAIALMLQDQSIEFVHTRALEWTKRLMLRGVELCEISELGDRFWKPAFDRAWENVNDAVRREHEGASLVLRLPPKA